MVCGFLVVIALCVAAFFAHKTRGKIWRYGKPNIYWEEPLVGGKASEGRDVEEWVRDDRVPVTAEQGLCGIIREKSYCRPSLTWNCVHGSQGNKHRRVLSPAAEELMKHDVQGQI